MLQFKVKEMLLAAGHRYPGKWLQRFCELGKGKAYSILEGKQKSINLRDFSKLYENLNCTPNDLMYWDEGKTHKLPATHPCVTQLTPPEKNADWATIFKQLTPDKILELHAIALQKLEKK